MGVDPELEESCCQIGWPNSLLTNFELLINKQEKNTTKTNRPSLPFPGFTVPKTIYSIYKCHEALFCTQQTITFSKKLTDTKLGCGWDWSIKEREGERRWGQPGFKPSSTNPQSWSSHQAFSCSKILSEDWTHEHNPYDGNHNIMRWTVFKEKLGGGRGVCGGMTEEVNVIWPFCPPLYVTG